MIHHLSYSSGNLQLDLPHHHANQFRPRKVIRSLVVAWGLPRLLTLPRIVQQAASVCFDNCDPFSFLPLKVILWWEKSMTAHLPSRKTVNVLVTQQPLCFGLLHVVSPSLFRMTRLNPDQLLEARFWKAGSDWLHSLSSCWCVVWNGRQVGHVVYL